MEPSFLTINPTQPNKHLLFFTGKKRKALTSCFSNKNINKHLHHVFLTKTSTNTYIMVFSHPKRAPTSCFSHKNTHTFYLLVPHMRFLFAIWITWPFCAHMDVWMDGWLAGIKPTFKMWARWDLFIQFLNDYHFHVDLCQQYWPILGTSSTTKMIAMVVGCSLLGLYKAIRQAFGFYGKFYPPNL